MKRPDFKVIKDYEEFERYYWYRDELRAICKSLEIDPDGNKRELEARIREYFKGNIVRKKKKNPIQKRTEVSELTLETPLLDCNYAMNEKFRNFFSDQIGISKFKFNANMAATWKKVKSKQDSHFTLGDMLEVYYGRSNYAVYDNTSCKWNRFYSDFCKDQKNRECLNKMKAASVLWGIVRDSTEEKRYSEELLIKYLDRIQEFYPKGCPEYLD